MQSNDVGVRFLLRQPCLDAAVLMSWLCYAVLLGICCCIFHLNFQKDADVYLISSVISLTYESLPCCHPIIIASGRAHSAGNRTAACARVQQARREEVEEVVFSYEEKKREEVDWEGCGFYIGLGLRL